MSAMMNNLENQECEACLIDAPHVSDEELNAFRKQFPDWHLIKEQGVSKLKKVYSFSNFVDALGFANSVGDLAETHGHHPDLLVEWGKCTVTWWSHEMRGLHLNDLRLAAKTNRI
jgi:4a-hydroxytetrahydrobiopterin dehydratase